MPAAELTAPEIVFSLSLSPQNQNAQNATALNRKVFSPNRDSRVFRGQFLSNWSDAHFGRERPMSDLIWSGDFQVSLTGAVYSGFLVFANVFDVVLGTIYLKSSDAAFSIWKSKL